MSLCKKFVLMCLTSFSGTHLFPIGWIQSCLKLIGRGTRTGTCVVNVERSLSGGRGVMMQLHCVSSQISLFESFKLILLSQSVVYSAQFKFKLRLRRKIYRSDICEVRNWKFLCNGNHPSFLTTCSLCTCLNALSAFCKGGL